MLGRARGSGPDHGRRARWRFMRRPSTPARRRSGVRCRAVHLPPRRAALHRPPAHPRHGARPAPGARRRRTALDRLAGPGPQRGQRDPGRRPLAVAGPRLALARSAEGAHALLVRRTGLGAGVALFRGA